MTRRTDVHRDDVSEDDVSGTDVHRDDVSEDDVSETFEQDGDNVRNAFGNVVLHCNNSKRPKNYLPPLQT